MSVIRFLILSISFLVSFNSFGQETASISFKKVEKQQKYDDLSLIEWKKFKRFETKLNLNEISSLRKSNQLRSYAKDSIQILGVKLMAIKLLDEKKLLDRDIRENTGYYLTVLDKLKASAISPSEYLFLEEKMAFINQSALEGKLARSQWLNAGLLVLSIVLILGSLVTQKKTETNGKFFTEQTRNYCTQPYSSRKDQQRNSQRTLHKSEYRKNPYNSHLQ